MDRDKDLFKLCVENGNSNGLLLSVSWIQSGNEAPIVLGRTVKLLANNLSTNGRTTIKIRSKFVGLIVGKGGRKIRDLEVQSGAKLEFGVKGDHETDLHIMGTTISKACAETMVLTFLANHLQMNKWKPYGFETKTYRGGGSSFNNYRCLRDVRMSPIIKTEHREPNPNTNRTKPSSVTDSTVFYNSSHLLDGEVSSGTTAKHKLKPIENDSYIKDERELNDEKEKPDWQELIRQCKQRTAEWWASFPQAQTNFYLEDPAVAAFTQEKVKQIRKGCNITVGYFEEENTDYRPIPNPIETFAQCFQHYPEILKEVINQGFRKPTPIQAQAWPIIMSGHDLIVISQTGTGKTLAFMLPALIHVGGQANNDEAKGPSVLVLSPTRELALQIEKEVSKYHYKEIKAVCIYDKEQQINAISKGVQVVIATPGRLIDLTSSHQINLNYVTYFVLDEADTMLDLGFETQIRKLLLDIHPHRQTVMTSATWPSGITRLAKTYLHSPIKMTVGSFGLAAVHSVTQKIIMVDEKDKIDTVIKFAESLKCNEKVIIFCDRKARADHLSSDLAIKGIVCSSIHDGRDQEEREEAIRDIQTGEVQILVATDIASRGLNFDDITHVLNFDFPKNIKEYVHRVGRTGRAGKRGIAITYLCREDWAQSKKLINILEEAGQFVPAEVREMAARYDKKNKIKTQRREKERKNPKF